MTNPGSQVLGSECLEDLSTLSAEYQLMSKTGISSGPILSWRNWSHIPTGSSTSPKKKKKRERQELLFGMAFYYLQRLRDL